jgi:hypothetical protein
LHEFDWTTGNKFEIGDLELFLHDNVFKLDPEVLKSVPEHAKAREVGPR